MIDKRYRGICIGMHVGAVGQSQAEARLRTEMAQIDRLRSAPARTLFGDCAARYLMQSQDLRSLDALRIHVRSLEPYIGHLEPQQVHDGTLAPFISARISAGACATTINRSLEVVRTILHRAARSYRDDDGHPWLDALPPLITMLLECRRPPYSITWEEQDRLFPRPPPHLARMALFAVNTGLRNSNVCGLRWSWEVPVPEIGRSVFVIPAAAIKTKRAHVVILNDAAWSIVQAQRAKHPVWVFTCRGHPIGTMNNNGWQQARRNAGVPAVRVHDLRHTFACRLRAAGVSAERSSGPIGTRHSIHGRSLRERRRGPIAAGIESGSHLPGNSHRTTGGKRLKN
jgi:integrase